MNFDQTKVIWIGKKKYSAYTIKTKWKLVWGQNFIFIRYKVSLFEGRVYRRKHTQTDGWTNGHTHTCTHDGHNAMTIARWTSASAAKN